MNKEQQKDEIILSVKKAIGVNSYYTEADNFLIDSNDVDHIAEQSAEMLYNAGYRKIDENCAVITKAELKEYKRQAVKEFIEKCKEYSKIYDKYNVIYRDVVLDVLDESLKEFLKRLYRIEG